MKIARLWAAASLAAVMSLGQIASAAPQQGAAPEPVKPVDPSRYVGRWYEIARLPNKLEQDCTSGTSDWARQGDGSFALVQTCHVGAANGPAKIWRAAGHILDVGKNSKIRIGFFAGLIHQDYWIIDRADDYSWCLMSTPSSRWLWIMARRPAVSPSLRASLVARARTLGYDTGRLIYDSPGA